MIKSVSIGIPGFAVLLTLSAIWSCKPKNIPEELSPALERSQANSTGIISPDKSVHSDPVAMGDPVPGQAPHSLNSEIDPDVQLAEERSGNSKYISNDSEALSSPLATSKTPMADSADPIHGETMAGGIAISGRADVVRKTDGTTIEPGKKNESEVDPGGNGSSGKKITSRSLDNEDIEEAPAEEELEYPTVLVWRNDAMDTNGILTVSYTIDVDETADLPNGLILSELIPPGWTIVNASIQPQAVNEKTRIAKWLFMENQVVDLSFFYQVEAVTDSASSADWQSSSSWYTYRRPYDGKPMEFYTQTY